MQLSKIYSNLPERFQDIQFHPSGLSVIFAKVKDPHNKDKDTHNLGKSTLAALIDFLLLKQTSKSFFLIKHNDVFSGFVFFLEIQVANGQYLTIRRSANKDEKKISIKKHDEGNQNLSSLKSGWNHPDISLEQGKALLNTLLGLEVVKPWGYRKGLSYFLRSQDDYNDVFHLAKNKGGNKDWQPYLFHILGFDGELLVKKHEIDDDIKKLKDERKIIQKDMVSNETSLGKLKGMITLEQNRIKAEEQNLEKFNFAFKEKNVQKELVEKVEQQISSLNERKYYISSEIESIKSQLAEKSTFNLDNVEKIFRESSLYFGNQLKKDYNEIVDFNKALTSDRNEYLAEMLSDNNKTLDKINAELLEINAQRKEYVDFLTETNIFSKYKLAQNKLLDIKTNVVRLEQQLEAAKKISDANNNILQLKQEKEKVAEEIQQSIQDGNQIYDEIRTKFSQIVREVLNETAIISIQKNRQHNIQFEAEIIGPEGFKTSQNKGASYKKLLCVAFDLAVLSTYEGQGFYHFVYHDGIFEALDDRKKDSLIKYIRSLTANDNIQHISTAIDSDWPLGEQGLRGGFKESEVVKKLHDEGSAGRLFVMPEF